MQRNFGRWVKQYEASKTENIEEMNRLITWLEERMPEREHFTVIHGDFRYNMKIFLFI